MLKCVCVESFKCTVLRKCGLFSIEDFVYEILIIIKLCLLFETLGLFDIIDVVNYKRDNRTFCHTKAVFETEVRWVNI